MENTEVVVSKKFSLDKYDWLKAALLTVAVPVTEYLLEALNAGGFEAIEWKHTAIIAVSTFLTYIAKNFLSTSSKAIQTTK